MVELGSVFGLIRRATIKKYNNDGTVQIQLDERGGQNPSQEYRVPMHVAWSGPSGEFIGGYPVVGSSVTVKQSQGGQWFIENYIPSFASLASSINTAVIKPGRAVMQVQGGIRLFADPKVGIQAGSSQSYMHLDPNRSISSKNFAYDMSFDEASRKVSGIILRDLVENSNRNILGSTLKSHFYFDSLTPISMDPTLAASISDTGGSIRNPPLVEQREVIYEFSESFNYQTDTVEAARATGQSKTNISLNKKDSRADTLSLGLQYPNHLMETIKGTVVDAQGNILDLNRNVIPIGKIEALSLRKNPDKEDALARIRAQERKSLAYHFELNVRKAGTIEDDGSETITPVPDVDDVTNYARKRSRLFVDVDKEGQWKINLPSSSETGNIALLTRYENYSTLVAKKDGVTDPNAFIKNSERKDIYIDSFAGKPSITLSGSDSLLDGYEAPIDRITGEPIKLGTAFHDILKVGSSFLPDAEKINLYEDNPITDTEPYEKIVEENIIVSGKDANAGGRSGTLVSDGHISLSIGASTSDRQSLWTDFAGGIVSQVGRDKRGISFAGNMDGDFILQLGGSGIGNTYDTRFSDLNDGSRIATVDIRLMAGDRPMAIFRMDKLGFRLVTEGKFQVQANQGIDLITHGNLVQNAEQVAFHTNTNMTRKLLRTGGNI